MELERDRFATFTFDPTRKVVELEWSSTTAEMTEDDFRHGISRLADHAQEHVGASLMVDTRAFGYRPAPDNETWRDENIVPRYNAAGVRKFAFLWPPGAVSNSTPAPEGPAAFPTGHFDSTERLEAWLAQA
jgi:hypothetical protein